MSQGQPIHIATRGWGSGPLAIATGGFFVAVVIWEADWIKVVMSMDEDIICNWDIQEVFGASLPTGLSLMVKSTSSYDFSTTAEVTEELVVRASGDEDINSVFDVALALEVKQ